MCTLGRTGTAACSFLKRHTIFKKNHFRTFHEFPRKCTANEICDGTGRKETCGHNENVQKGQGVQMGQVIGLMGDTGYSFGCHLHFVTKYNNQVFNPFNLYK